MKRRNSAFEKISSGKGFYIAAAIAFCAIIVSIVAVYYTSDRLGQSLPKADENFTTYFSLPAEVNKTDVPDERDLEIEDDTTTTAVQTTAETTQPTTVPTTTTTQEAKIVNYDFVLPSGGDIIKKYSASEPIYSKTMNDWRTHSGVDFAAQEGEEAYSVGNGKVTKVISDPKWGYVIEIDCGSFTARYCGIDQSTAVAIDTVVKKGDSIGKIADIPIESEDGLHLHFEVISNGKSIDPISVLGVN